MFKMKTTKRLLTAFALFVLLVAGLSGFAVYTGRYTAELFSKVVSLKEDEIAAQRVVKRFFEGRMHVLDALTFADPSRWDAYDFALERVHVRLNQFLEREDDEFAAASDLKNLIEKFEQGAVVLRQFKTIQDAMESPEGNVALNDLSDISKAINQMGNDISNYYDNATKAYRAIANQRIARIIDIAIIFGALSMLMGLVLTYALTHSIAKPVKQMTDVMESLAAGNLSVEVPEHATEDEFGDMAKAVKALKETAKKSEAVLAEEESARKQGRAPVKWLRG